MEHYQGLFWQAYLVNFIFWISLAQGAVIFSAALNLTTAKWGRPYVSIARSFAGFLPVSVILFAILLLGRNFIFPWIAEPLPLKAAYLNVPFLAVRGLVGLGLLAFLSWMFLRQTKDAPLDSLEASPWAVFLVISFMAVYTYLAFDLIMSLQPTWYSTLLGAHFALSAFFLGIAGLCLAGFVAGGIPAEERRRISKLLFAFSLFWMSLLWSQYIVIWYGDIPEETQFVYLIFFQYPWRAITIASFFLSFVFPFVILMPKEAKTAPFFPLVASIFIVFGLLLEKYVLVIPSFHPNTLAVNWIHAVVTIGFGILFYVSCTFVSPFLKLS
jgi:hypothetical protein